MRLIEFIGQVDERHRLLVELPPEIPAGTVKIITSAGKFITKTRKTKQRKRPTTSSIRAFALSCFRLSRFLDSSSCDELICQGNTLQPVPREDEEQDRLALTNHFWAKDWSDARQDIYTVGGRFMSTATGRATFADLYRTEGKAELIGGRIVKRMATGRRPNRVALRIVRSLDDYAQARGVGEAYTDNMGFAVPMLPSGRESFSPDASYYDGPFPADEMRFIEGPPTFAVEVRSEGDYGNAAEVEMAAKRADYFTAGTLVVWDVDPVADTITSYRVATPTQATMFHRGDVADAEPAVPGWRIDVDKLFA